MSQKTVYRKIHTNLYSTKAADILTKFFAHVAEYSEAKFRRHISGGSVFVEPNGEVVLLDTCCYDRTIWRKKKTDLAVLDHIAWMLKLHVHSELRRVLHHNEPNVEKVYWNRGNRVDCIACCKRTANDVVTVADIYCIYDLFKNRKGFEKRYPKELVDEIVGVQKDPIQTEMEVARRQEIVNIKEKYTKLMNNCNVESYDSLWVKDEHLTEAALEARKMLTALKAKWAAKKQELAKQRDEEIAALNQTLNFMVG